MDSKLVTYLFLDDLRHPNQCCNYMPADLRDMYSSPKWKVVRSFHEFVEYIITRDLPEIISFDHDLCDKHYMINNSDWQHYYKETTREKTGYCCAKWLKEFLEEHNLETPKIYAHTMNPVGKENILNLFK